jgi:crotonobetainyl-CoA:carnitine CoA-transferase CaiB-like acyl-CoA transferase
MSLPLQGVRVCDLTWIVAGPSATRVMADFGADVVRVEYEQTLDAIRFGRPFVGDEPDVNRSGFFNNLNRNKRSISLNVRHPEGFEVLKRLIAASDVLVENYSSRVLESWELGFEELQAIRADIIYCSLSGFGHSGRSRDYSSWGPTAQALSGLTLMSGLPGEEPAGWGFSYMDHTAGYLAAIAILAALHHRRKTGEGQHIDMSQVEAGIVLTGAAIPDFVVNGRSYRRLDYPPGNRSEWPRVAPHNTYACQGEDAWVAIACLTDAEWRALVRAMGEPEWAKAPEFATMEARYANQDALDAQIGQWTGERERYAVMATLQSAGVRCGVVQHASDKVDLDEQLRARGFLVKATHPEIGEARFEAPVPRLSVTPGEVRSASPVLGADTNDVLAELGYSEDDVLSLMEQGVFS